MRTQNQSNIPENPYEATATAYIGTRKQPLLVSLLRGSYVLLWLVVIGTNLPDMLGFVTYAENRSLYDGLWMLGALAHLGIFLYMFHYTLSRILLAHILLWGMYAIFISLMIFGVHDFPQPPALFFASNFLWPIVIWRLRGRNPLHRFMLRATAILSVLYLVTFTANSIADHSPIFSMIFFVADGLDLLSHAVVLAPYSFPELYPERKSQRNSD